MKVNTFSERLKEALRIRNIRQIELSEKTHIPKSAICQYLSGRFEPKQNRLSIIAAVLDVSEAWLMGYDVSISRENSKTNFPIPNITNDYTTFAVIGEIAAGYDSVALEDWEGDTVDIPNEYLNGRNRDDFFVLRVKGDSMYPDYKEGDKVLILKQTTLNYSGQVGVILYDGELASLKKVEYKKGEDWLKMVPVNPMHPTKKIEGAELENCRILGIPRLLIRNIID